MFLVVEFPMMNVSNYNIHIPYVKKHTILMNAIIINSCIFFFLSSSFLVLLFNILWLLLVVGIYLYTLRILNIFLVNLLYWTWMLVVVEDTSMPIFFFLVYMTPYTLAFSKYYYQKYHLYAIYHKLYTWYKLLVHFAQC